MPPVIEANGLSKRYRLGTSATYGRLTESLANTLSLRRRRPPDEAATLWALRDVSFEVEQGEVVGLIGRNGAGKSTLLKILSRITEPTRGTVRLRGRVGSLLEVGTGFHPELTGRENIVLNGSILGMKRREIEAKFDEIVAFAEMSKFLDTPVKRYSSGMYVRLAFAVAAHLDPEVLLVDEVLAVGDIAFQRKCLGKMSDVATQGRTVLFVSHNMAAIENLCNRALLLEDGEISERGPVDQVIPEYLRRMESTDVRPLADRVDREGNGRIRFTGLETHSEKGGSVLVSGADGELIIQFEAVPDVRRVQVSVGVFTPLGDGVLYLANELTGQPMDSVPAQGSFHCRIPRTPLTPGLYSVNLFVTVAGHIADWVRDAGRIQVVEGDYFSSGRLPPSGYGSVMVDHDWAVRAQ